MRKRPQSLEAFKEALRKEKIRLVVRQNDKGIVYGLTYIDHQSKCVFNGSDIGKEYSAKAILEKCGITQTNSTTDYSIKTKLSVTEKVNPNISDHRELKHDLSNILDKLITPHEQNNYVPSQLTKQKKKKSNTI
jgi:hypothetical protein